MHADTIGDTLDLREALGRALSTLGRESPRLVVLDGGAAEENGADHFRREHPERFLNFGHAQQNMLAAAAGLESVGLRPVVTSAAALCLRAVEQARFALAFSSRNVKLVGCRAGIDGGADGAPMQVVEDVAAFRAIPNMTVLSPADSVATAAAVRAMISHDGPVYMRIASRTAEKIFDGEYRFEIGKGRILRPGRDVTIVACGIEVGRALEAAARLAEEAIDARVIDMATVKPLDTEILVWAANETGAIVTAEDHNVMGGLGSAVAEALAQLSPCPVEFVGVQDRFGTCGNAEELADRYGLSAPHIAEAAKRAIARKKPQ